MLRNGYTSLAGATPRRFQVSSSEVCTSEFDGDVRCRSRFHLRLKSGERIYGRHIAFLRELVVSTGVRRASQSEAIPLGRLRF